MAGMATPTRLASFCDGIDVIQALCRNGLANGALSDLIALANNLIGFSFGRKIHEFKELGLNLWNENDSH